MCVPSRIRFSSSIISMSLMRLLTPPHRDPPSTDRSRGPRHSPRAADVGAPRRPRRLPPTANCGSSGSRPCRSRDEVDAYIETRSPASATATCCRGPCASSRAARSSAARATTTSSPRSIASRSATRGTRELAAHARQHHVQAAAARARVRDAGLRGRRAAHRQLQLRVAARDRSARREEGRRDPPPPGAPRRHGARHGDVQHPRAASGRT